MGRFGKGDQGPEQRIRFARMLDEMMNKELFTEFGCGRFQDGFLHLFSQDLDVLDPLLETWSFLLPEAEGRRKVIGRNAYGALLILEDFDTKGGVAPALPCTQADNYKEAQVKYQADYIFYRSM